MTDEDLEQTLEAIAAFLRSESYAACTYDAAIARARDGALRAELVRVRNSHAARALLLRERLDEFGGEHEARGCEAVPWGAFANACRRVAGARDDDALLEALREGEGWAVRDYEIDLVEVGPPLRDEIGPVLLSEQRRTCDRVWELTARRAPVAPPRLVLAVPHPALIRRAASR